MSWYSRSYCYSDYKRINKDTIHRIFSVDYPSLRDIPCIFMYDCCDGDNDQERTENRIISADSPTLILQKSKGNDNNKESEGLREVNNVYGQDQQIWYKNEPNPDYKLVIINSSNTGFVSQIGSKSGSYMIKKFTEKMKQNLQGRNKLFLYQIFHQIQTELHDGGKQLVEAKYNNKLEFIKFRKNDQRRAGHAIELEQILTKHQKEKP